MYFSFIKKHFLFKKTKNKKIKYKKQKNKI